MKVAIILNACRITPALMEKLNDKTLAEKYDLNLEIFVKMPAELSDFMHSLNLKDYNALIVGGGDGTVRIAAELLSGTETPLAILPIGSFNILARSLGFTNDIEALFALIKNKKMKQIDVGDVNGHIFINHAWIGVYYYLLKLREKYRAMLGTSQTLKTLFNVYNFFKTIPHYDLEFVADNTSQKINTCLVYISNNEQSTNLLNFAERKSLSLGLLSVYVFKYQGRWELFKSILSIMGNTFQDSPNVTKFLTDNLTIHSKHSHINTVLDGELRRLETPLHYSINKKQLTVFIP